MTLWSNNNHSMLSGPATTTVAESEDLPHNPSDEESASGSRSQSRFTNETSNNKSFSLAGSETRMINYSKGVFLVVIAVFALTASIITYKVIEDQEYKEYKRKVRAYTVN